MVWLNCGNSKGIIHIAHRPWVFNACRPYMKSIREESLGFMIQDGPAWQTCCLSHLFMGQCFWGTLICNLQYDAYILVQRESKNVLQLQVKWCLSPLLFFSYIMMVSHGFEKSVWRENEQGSRTICEENLMAIKLRWRILESRPVLVWLKPHWARSSKVYQSLWICLL